MTTIDIQLVGTDLPGVSCGDYRNVHVGVQRRKEPEQLTPAQGEQVRLGFPVDVVGSDVKGPYVQGGPGGRFFYLTWGELPPGGVFAMFGRAKIYFADIDPELIAQAAATGRALRGTVGLTGRTGLPLFASVRPPVIGWQLV